MHTKLYINIKSGEVSIEGSEEFVSKQIENIEDIISLMQLDGSSNTNTTDEPADESSIDASKETGDNESSNPIGELVVPSVFGEWLHKFKDAINDQDKALITAYYVQQDSDKNDFKTAQINKSLKDHGIKLPNTSTTLKQIENKKLIFQTRKVGKLSYKRVSADGKKHLKSLLR